MKRFFTSLATFSLAETLGRHPVIAGVLSLLGVGGGAVIATNLITPTLTPFISSNFNTNQIVANTSNGLKPNGGTAGAMELPTNAPDSFANYFELKVDANLAYGTGAQSPFLGMLLTTNGGPGQPAFSYQRTVAGIAGSQWWLNPGNVVGVSGSVSGASNYITGLLPFTAPAATPPCTRAPTGIMYFFSPATFQQLDPGLGCPTGTQTLNAAAVLANIPGSGAQQNTIATSTCAVVNSRATMTAHVAVAHGINPGDQYAMGSFTTTPAGVFNTTFTALPGTSGTTLVGTPTTTLALCPTSWSGGNAPSEGTAFSGTGASISFPAISATSPYGGSIGITAKNNQRICGFIGEYGDDSPFPGAQFVTMVDEKGNPLPGSPALVSTPNQGDSNFNGWLTSGSNVLNVSVGLKPYVITSAAYSTGTGGLSGVGLVTFQVSTNPGYVPGSEFTVSGMLPSSVNGTYIAVAGTTSSQIVGNQITGPQGIPQAYANPGAITLSGSPQMVSVVLPGQTVLLATPGQTYILPYGTNGTTGVGADGTYALSSTQTASVGSSGSPAVLFTYSSFYYTAATSGNPAAGVVTARTPGASGDFLSLIGNNAATLTSGSGWGGAIGNVATLWGILPSQTGSAPSTADLASICTKQTDIQTYAAAKSLKVNALYRLNDLGIWGDSGNATITGYITNAGGTAATLNVVSTTFGSLALATGTETADLTGDGLPVASPVTIPLTTSAGSTYAITPNTTAALGSVGAPVTFAVGAWKPALPIQSTTVKGYIDTTAGVSTLHATSFDDGSAHNGFASFTGQLGTSFTARIDDGGTANVNPGNVLTVTSPNIILYDNAAVGVGTVVCPAGVGTAVNTTPFTGGSVNGCVTVTALGTGLGVAGTYTISGSAQNITSQVMFGRGVLAGPATSLQVASVTGTISNGMLVTDGGASLTGAPLLITGGGALAWTVSANYYSVISADATMQASLSTLVPGAYIQNSAITNPVKIVADPSNGNGLAPGTYKLSGSPNSSNAVGSSGSPVVFTGTTITDGGAIAPGPALTIDDKGAGIFYRVDFSTNTGALNLSGTYDVPTLGGTPTGIQVLVSNSANGPALAGCTPCNWGALTATISGGKWSGKIAGIPGGGPYFVSVRATNGTAYATLPNAIRVGAAYATWGDGQIQSMFGSQGGLRTSWFNGLWGYLVGRSYYGVSYLVGPPVTSNFSPGNAGYYAGDRYGVGGTGTPVAESILAFDQGITNGFGVPAALAYAARDGIGTILYALGNIAQMQTIGLGDGSKTVWCSASTFCSNVDVGFPLALNASSLTGGWFTGSVSGSTLTVTTRQGGAVSPGMVLSAGTGVVGAPTLLRCITLCAPILVNGSTWQLSDALSTGATGTSTTPLRVDPPLAMIPLGGTKTPWPNFNAQGGAATIGPGGAGWNLVKAGTFKIIDTDSTGLATILCQDNTAFAYNNTLGNCTPIGGASPAVSSAFVNYQTGDYEVTFATAPVAGHSITASWLNIVSPQGLSTQAISRPQGEDQFGDGTQDSGYVSNMFSRFPSGVNGQIMAGQGLDGGYYYSGNTYENGATGYMQFLQWLFGTKFPAVVPGAVSTVPFMTGDIFRSERPPVVFNSNVFAKDNIMSQWAEDATTPSTFTGTVASSVLTLTADAVGPMGEGELLGCVTYSPSACSIGPLSSVYILNLHSGSPAGWGKATSTYDLANASSITIATAAAMQNPVYYSVPGASSLFLGTANDITECWATCGSVTTGGGVHPGGGFTGFRRIAARWAAEIYEASIGGKDPNVARTNDVAAGTPSPAFDYGAGGTTYNAVQTGTVSTIGGVSSVDFPSGIAAHARPFVVGHWITCAGCTPQVITAVSVPPAQSTATGAGEVGQDFQITLSGLLGVTGSKAITGGCHSVSGSGGSNCIDIDIALNVSGSFGTAQALDTCGENNVNGTAPNYSVPNGKCAGNGIGSLVRVFRIGTQQTTNGDGLTNVAAGSVFDDGFDVGSGAFTQSAAYTCNIVAGKVVQCVKAPLYTAGVYTSVGKWASASTYISYGDGTMSTARAGTLLGYVGGQSYPFTAGSGYTANSQQTVSGTGCSLAAGGTAPKFDFTFGASGTAIGAVPSASSPATGLGALAGCTFTATLGGGTGGAVGPITVTPTEGQGGIGTVSSDQNTMGTFLYDNSGEPGNPLNSFFTDGTGGYFEPGLPVRPFGQFQGAMVSG